MFLRGKTLTDLARISAPIGLRALAVLMSLCAVVLSYRLMSPEQFTELNLILFSVAIGSSISAPINRQFWIEDPKGVYPLAMASTLVVSFVSVFLVFLLPKLFFSGGVDVAATQLIIFAIIVFFVLSKTSERFISSLNLSDGLINKSILTIALFSFAEIASLGLMYWFLPDTVEYRLFFPALIFIFCIALMKELKILSPVAKLFLRPKEIFLNIYASIMRSPGPSVLFLMVLGTGAGMVDRLLIAYGVAFDADFGADYLLALSYAIAIQTVLNILFDLARRNIYFQNRWQEVAEGYAIGILTLAAVTCASVILIYPILTWVGVVPSTLPWIMWAAMVLRSTLLLAGYITFVDQYQKGNMAPQIIISFSVLSSVVFSFLLLSKGFSISFVSLAMVSGYSLLFIVLCLRLLFTIKNSRRFASAEECR